MARMVVVGRHGARGGMTAEELLAEALGEQLSSEWTVYRNVDFLERGKAQEGEADFLCVHRTEGILLIECKGGGVARGPDGRWYRDSETGPEPLSVDPMSQAQRAIKALGLEMRRRFEATHRAQPFPWVTGHAVAFPRTRKDDLNWPLTWAPELSFDCDDLANIGQSVQKALRFWRSSTGGRDRQPLAEEAHDAFFRRLFRSIFHLAPSIGANMELDRQRLLRLSPEQRRWIQGFLSAPRLNVTGSAGTGKTVLAVEAACRLAERGEKTLLVCFTRGLAHHLYRTVQGQSPSPGNPWVASFHGLCRQAAAQLQVPFDVPDASHSAEDRREFWRTQAPLFLLEAALEGKVGGYDAIVVDEGQDFAPGWWGVIEELFADKARGRLFVFHDPGQAIFGRPTSIPEAPTFTLTTNFRNSRSVAELLQKLSPDGSPHAAAHPDAPEGQAPSFRRQGNTRQLLTALDGEIHRLLRGGVRAEDIVLLTPHSRKHSSLADTTSLAGRSISTLRNRTAGDLTHATISAFKGLEAEVVFLMDVKPGDPRADRAARYVAASRARSRLHVFTHDGAPLA